MAARPAFLLLLLALEALVSAEQSIEHDGQKWFAYGHSQLRNFEYDLVRLTLRITAVCTGGQQWQTVEQQRLFEPSESPDLPWMAFMQETLEYNLIASFLSNSTRKLSEVSEMLRFLSNPLITWFRVTQAANSSHLAGLKSRLCSLSKRGDELANDVYCIVQHLPKWLNKFTLERSLRTTNASPTAGGPFVSSDAFETADGKYLHDFTMWTALKDHALSNLIHFHEKLYGKFDNSSLQNKMEQLCL